MVTHTFSLSHTFVDGKCIDEIKSDQEFTVFLSAGNPFTIRLICYSVDDIDVGFNGLIVGAPPPLLIPKSSWEKDCRYCPLPDGFTWIDDTSGTTQQHEYLKLGAISFPWFNNGKLFFDKIEVASITNKKHVVVAAHPNAS